MSVAEDVRPAPLLYEVRESGVAILTFNRPERDELLGRAHGRRVLPAHRHRRSRSARPRHRHHRIGRAFCAGADMGGLDAISEVTVDSASKTDVSTMVAARHPYFLTQLTKPVIAAINGAVAGMGLSQALMADIRFAAAGAKFTTSFARRGLVAEYGISWILPRLVGWATATELLLSGRTFLAEEAAELGLVKEAVPRDELMDRVLAYADDMAINCAPSSMAIMKRQLYADAGMAIVETSEKPRNSCTIRCNAPTSSRASRPSSRSARRTSCPCRAHCRTDPKGFSAMTTLEKPTPAKLDYEAIDVDNHYYETTDAFTRHLPKEFAAAGADGAGRQADAGGVRRRRQPLHPQPDVRPHHRAGLSGPAVPRRDSRGRKPGLADEGGPARRPSRVSEPRRPGEDPRQAEPETVFMLPIFACGVEEAPQTRHPRHHGVAARVQPMARRGLGFRPVRPPGHRVAPIISLADPVRRSEVDYVLGADAKMVCVRPAPVPVVGRGIGRPAPRPGVGAAGRGRHPGRSSICPDSGYMAIPALWGGSGVLRDSASVIRSTW